MTIVFGLAAAIFWGVTDFLGGPAARRVGVAHVVWVTNLIGLVAVAVILAIAQTARHKLTSASWVGVLYSLAAAACLLAATTTLSRALRSGNAAIIAPIAMSYGTVTTALSFLGGERLGTLQWVGIGICMAGIPLTGMTRQRTPDRDDSPVFSVALAFTAMACFGVSYWLQGHFAVPRVGSVGYLFVNYLCVALAVTLFIWIAPATPPQSGRAAPQRRYAWVFAQGATSLLGLGAFSLGLASGTTSVVAVLSTFSGAVTALLARAFRHEPLSGLQWLGIGIVLTGTVIVRL